MKKYIKSAIQNVTDMDVADQIDIAMCAKDPNILQQLLDNPNGANWVVKLAIVDNSCVTEDILKQLTEDFNGTVREAAKYNLENRE